LTVVMWILFVAASVLAYFAFWTGLLGCSLLFFWGAITRQTIDIRVSIWRFRNDFMSAHNDFHNDFMRAHDDFRRAFPPPPA